MAVWPIPRRYPVRVSRRCSLAAHVRSTLATKLKSCETRMARGDAARLLSRKPRNLLQRASTRWIAQSSSWAFLRPRSPVMRLARLYLASASRSFCRRGPDPDVGCFQCDGNQSRCPVGIGDPLLVAQLLAPDRHDVIAAPAVRKLHGRRRNVAPERTERAGGFVGMRLDPLARGIQRIEYHAQHFRMLVRKGGSRG